MRLILLRHAPGLSGGRIAGRSDIEADCSDQAALAALAARLQGPVDKGARILCSAARRCLQTAEALGLAPDAVRPELWEQDLGAWEGTDPALLPDLGPLSPAALARHRPPGGESFHDMAARVIPVLTAQRGDSIIIAHAGTVRAALSMVVGPCALSFAVAPLSATILMRAGPDWAIEAVNLTEGPW